jgi:hypothetical protein
VTLKQNACAAFQRSEPIEYRDALAHAPLGVDIENAADAQRLHCRRQMKTRGAPRRNELLERRH